MMKRSTCIFAAVLLAAVWALSCSKQAVQTTYDKQTTNIEKFLEAQMKADTNARLTLNDGAYRLVLHDTLPAHRDSLREGGRVSLHYACYTLTSSSVSKSNLIATNRESVAKSAGWTLSDTTQFKLDTLRLDGSLLEGLRRGLLGVKAQDEGYILFNGKYGFGKKEHGMIPANAALVYQIWIEQIYND